MLKFTPFPDSSVLRPNFTVLHSVLRPLHESFTVFYGSFTAHTSSVLQFYAPIKGVKHKTGEVRQGE